MREALVAAVLALPVAVGLSASGPAQADDPDVAFTFEDTRIVESSGLVIGDDLAVTVNDSGDEARVFTVDPSTGRTLGVTRWDADVEDVEALAPAGPDEVWVGDVGDNAKRRDHVTVTRVPVGPGDRTVDPETYELTYPDGSFDCEALLVHPRTGRLYLVTKDFIGGSVYAAPERLSRTGPNRLTRIGDGQGLVTDGAFFPDGRHLVLRNYSTAAVYAFPSLQRLATFALPSQQQGEGIAVSPEGRVFLSSEGVRAPVLEVAPDVVRRALTGVPETTAPPTGGVEPTADDGTADPDPWQWLLGSVVAVAAIVVLVRSLRPR